MSIDSAEFAENAVNFDSQFDLAALNLDSKSLKLDVVVQTTKRYNASLCRFFGGRGRSW